MSSALPFELDNLTGAAARVFIAPYSASLPATPDIIYDQSAPYNVNTPWLEVGATAGPLQVSRNLTVAGFTIEQSQTPLLEEPTEILYTVQVAFAELSPQTLKLLNEGVTESVSAAVGRSAGTKTNFGNIYELSHYRVAFAVRRVKKQGEVIEGTGGKHRGRYLTYVGYDATMTGENVQTSFGRGQLSQAPVTFKLYPDATITDEGEEHGYWFDEAAGTIALT